MIADDEYCDECGETADCYVDDMALCDSCAHRLDDDDEDFYDLGENDTIKDGYA